MHPLVGQHRSHLVQVRVGRTVGQPLIYLPGLVYHGERLLVLAEAVQPDATVAECASEFSLVRGWVLLRQTPVDVRRRRAGGDRVFMAAECGQDSAEAFVGVRQVGLVFVGIFGGEPLVKLQGLPHTVQCR